MCQVILEQGFETRKTENWQRQLIGISGPIRTARKGGEGLPPPTTEEAKMKKQKFPPGWDEKRVRQVIAHYENQTEDEELAEIEADLQEQNVTMMAVPTDLVPDVRALLARKQSA
jgi:hypothetical protein